MKLRFALIWVAFAVLFFLSMSQNALACSCAQPAPGMSLKDQVRNSREGSTAVFMAEVISVSEAAMGEFTDRQVKVKITQTYKGNITGEIVIFTGHDSAMCGYEFAAGKSYLIYANGENGKLSVNNCSRTAQAPSAKKDIKILKKFRAHS
jgi:hypothetical protein